MEFIQRSLHMAGQHKARLLWGIFFIVIQNASILMGFFGLFMAFTWMDGITMNRLLILFGILMGSFLFNFLAGWLQNALIAGVFFTIFRDYRLEVGEKLKKAPMGYFAEQSLSRILAGFTNVIKSLENYSSMALDFSFAGLSVCLFLLIGMFSMNVKIGLVALICLSLVWLFVLQLMKVAQKETAIEHAAVTEVSDALIDGIRGIPVLRSFPQVERDTVEKIHQGLSDASTHLLQAKTHFEKVFVIYSRIFTTLINVSSLVVTLFGCYLYTKGEVTLAQALTLSAAGFMIFGGLRQLENASVLMVKNPAHMKYLEEVLDIPEIADGTVEELSGKREISFNNVSFGYEASRPIIQDLSFTIPEGSRTAIVGPSGAGKSTVINLLARFYDPQEGKICLGGEDLRSYEVRTLLTNLSLVFQDVYLFSDTIENNIRFAKPEASHEEVVRVAKKARCHDFIMKLPQGYQTPVGEGGSSLSGGEKQRISIARALLKDAPIILLDEATSSIDPENEHEILSAIDELTKGHTVISIAHRLSTVKEADQILVMDSGKLVQKGTHEELVKIPGIYASFIQARNKASNWTLT